MKNQAVVTKYAWLVAICLGSMLALSACKHAGEHPAGEHPSEHPSTKQNP